MNVLKRRIKWIHNNYSIPVTDLFSDPLNMLNEHCLWSCTKGKRGYVRKHKSLQGSWCYFVKRCFPFSCPSHRLGANAAFSRPIRWRFWLPLNETHALQTKIKSGGLADVFERVDVESFSKAVVCTPKGLTVKDLTCKHASEIIWQHCVKTSRASMQVDWKLYNWYFLKASV